MGWITVTVKTAAIPAIPTCVRRLGGAAAEVAMKEVFLFKLILLMLFGMQKGVRASNYAVIVRFRRRRWERVGWWWRTFAFVANESFTVQPKTSLRSGTLVASIDHVIRAFSPKKLKYVGPTEAVDEAFLKWWFLYISFNHLGWRSQFLPRRHVPIRETKSSCVADDAKFGWRWLAQMTSGNYHYLMSSRSRPVIFFFPSLLEQLRRRVCWLVYGLVCGFVCWDVSGFVRSFLILTKNRFLTENVR